jgi:predicted AAA+ superfamily ATPase
MCGALFENLVIGEFIKQRFNAGQPAELYFLRDNIGHEVDLLFETPIGMQTVEIKSGMSFDAEDYRAFSWHSLMDRPAPRSTDSTDGTKKPSSPDGFRA